MKNSTPTDAATSRPWHLNPRDSTWIDGLDAQPVATTAHGSLKFHEQQANAALIVRAVNLLEAHEAVAEELPKFLDWLREFFPDEPALAEDSKGMTNESLLRLDKALAQLAKLKEENK